LGVAEKLRRLRPAQGSYSGEVLATLFANGLILGGNILAGVMLARLLGPEGRGRLAAIQALPFVVGTVGTLGVFDAIVYFGGKDRRHIGRYATSATALVALAGVPIVLLAALLTPLFLRAQPPDVVRASQWCLLLLFSNAALGISIFSARAAHDISTWNRLRLLPPLSWLATVGSFMVLGVRNPGALALTYVGLLVVIALPMLVPVRSRFAGQWRPDVSTWWPMLRYGLPVAAGATPQMLNQRLDQLLIAGMLPAEQLGLYAVAVSWSSIAMMPGLAMHSVAFSKIASTSDPGAQASFIGKATRVIVVISLVAAAGLAVTGPVAIPLVFGIDFAPSATLAFPLLAAAVAKTVALMLQESMKGIGSTRGVMYAEWSALACLVATAPPFITTWRAQGAGLAILGASLVSLGVSAAYLRARLRETTR